MKRFSLAFCLLEIWLFSNIAFGGEQPISVFRTRHCDEVSTLIPNQQGKQLISQAWLGKELFRWDLQSGILLDEINDRFRFPHSKIKLSKDKQSIILVDVQMVTLFDVDTLEKTVEYPLNNEIFVTLEDKKGTIYGLGHDRRKRTRMLNLYDVKHDRLIQSFDDSDGYGIFSPFQLTGDAKILMIGTMGNGLVRWFDTNSGKVVRTIEVESSGTPIIRLSPDDRYLLTGTRKSLKLWDLQTGEAKTILGGNQLVGTLFDFTPDGKHLIYTAGGFLTDLPGCSHHGTHMYLAELSTGKTIRYVGGNFGGEDEFASITSFSFYDKGCKILIGTCNGQIGAWNIPETCPAQ